MMKAATGVLMANRLTISWGTQFRRLFDGLRGFVVSEASSFALVTGVLGLLMLMRQSIQFAINSGLPTITVSEVVSGTWDDFTWHGMGALAMFCVIQPVRRRLRVDGMRRVAVLVGTVAIAAVLATCILMLLFVLNDPGSFAYLVNPREGGIIFVRYALPAAFVVTVAEFHRREILSLEATRRAEADRTALEQETLQARLKTLEAQIEPHFLFNTLANVRRLYETDAAAGETMLERLMRYLVVALPSMRDELPTLGREAQLIEAYLDLQQVRMGRRLSYSVDIAPALREISVPSMMLLTLVENAIKHGLAPLREGGRVDVFAHVEGTDLQLDVADTGRGFGDDTSGMGTGLANIQARLAAMFGEAAALTLMPGRVRGLLATIRMPLRAAQ
jgi:sensor histidine kinase YesM